MCLERDRELNAFDATLAYALRIIFMEGEFFPDPCQGQLD